MSKDGINLDKRIMIPRSHWLCQWSGDRLYCVIGINEQDIVEGFEIYGGDVICYDAKFNVIWIYKNEKRLPIGDITVRENKNQVELYVSSGGRIYLDFSGNFVKFEDGR